MPPEQQEKKRSFSALSIFAYCLLAIAVGGGIALLWRNQIALQNHLQQQSKELGNLRTDNKEQAERIEKLADDVTSQTAQDIGRIEQKLTTLQDTQEGVAHSLQDLQQDVSKLPPRPKPEETDLQKKAAEEARAAAQAQVDKMEILAQYQGELQRKATGQRDPGAETPVSFLKFTTSDWSSRVTTLDKKLQSMPVWGKQNLQDPTYGQAFFELGGILLVDGIFLNQIFTYDVSNNLPNIVYVLAPALATVDGATIGVYGDTELDEVLLDGCLTWKKTGAKHGMDFWEANDTDMVARMVKVNSGVKVSVEKSCDNRYTMRRLVNYVSGVQNNEFFEHFKLVYTGPAVATVAGSLPLASKEEDLAFYEDKIKDMATGDFRNEVQLLVEAIKSGALPPRFMRWIAGSYEPPTFFLMQWPTSGFSTSPSIGPKDCPDGIEVPVPDGANFKCYMGRHFFAVQNGTSTVENPGDNFYFGAPGNHKLISGWGFDVVVLKKGWGRQVIQKDCSKSDLTNAAFGDMTRGVVQYSDIGISTDRNGKYEIIISDVRRNSPAAMAGIKRGDMLLSIDGVAAAYFDQYHRIQQLRGPAGSVVKIITLTPPGVVEKESVLARDGNFQEANQAYLKTYDYKPPFKYGNFILFDKGVSSKNMKWNKDHTSLKNTVTGDEVVFTHPACYNLAYLGK